MASEHGSRRRYADGCRCPGCREANADYQRDYRERSVAAGVSDVAGRVELAVAQELGGLAQSAARPGLVAVALALARVLDNPRAVSAQPSAAGKLKQILGELHKGVGVRSSRLALVRGMTTGDST